jgi:hypothetical protein
LIVMRAQEVDKFHDDVQCGRLEHFPNDGYDWQLEHRRAHAQDIVHGICAGITEVQRAARSGIIVTRATRQSAESGKLYLSQFGPQPGECMLSSAVYAHPTMEPPKLLTAEQSGGRATGPDGGNAKSPNKRLGLREQSTATRYSPSCAR